MAERFAGTKQMVLIEEENKRMQGYLDGRLSNNHVVHLKGEASLIGKIVKVRLDECKGFYYIGKKSE